MARIRSPNYPALSLPDAIGRVRLVHQKQQTTPEPREVVVKHMGYNTMNGRALKALSALLKYGLLEEHGKGLRVSTRAISILFPDPTSDAAKSEAISAAAKAPDLFRRIVAEKGSKPSPESLKHFLIREGFNLNSVDQVAQAFYDTLDLVDKQGAGYESSVDDVDVNEEEEDMQPEPNPAVKRPLNPEVERQSPPTGALNSTKPIFDFETVAINTKIDNQEDLAELIKRLEQIKAMLPPKTQH